MPIIHHQHIASRRSTHRFYKPSTKLASTDNEFVKTAIISFAMSSKALAVKLTQIAVFLHRTGSIPTEHIVECPDLTQFELVILRNILYLRLRPAEVIPHRRFCRARLVVSFAVEAGGGEYQWHHRNPCIPPHFRFLRGMIWILWSRSPIPGQNHQSPPGRRGKKVKSHLGHDTSGGDPLVVSNQEACRCIYTDQSRHYSVHNIPVCSERKSWSAGARAYLGRRC
jgi:hypothetical protein